MATAAQAGLARGGGDDAFYRGKLRAAQYWIATELPRTDHLARLCASAEDSYARITVDEI
jgi:butyryl-CoA dehydrogenase